MLLRPASFPHCSVVGLDQHQRVDRRGAVRGCDRTRTPGGNRERGGAAVRRGAYRRRDAQTRPTVPPPPPGTPVEIALDDAVQRALERNLDIAVERLNPQAFDFSLAAFEGQLPARRSRPRSACAVSRSFPGVRRPVRRLRVLTTETFTGNTGITQNLKWGGGSFAASFNNNRQSQSDAFATRNPALNTNFNLTFRAAAAAQLPHRRHPGAAADHSAESGDVSEIALRADDRQDPGRRSKRVLGSHLRASKRRKWPKGRSRSHRSWSRTIRRAWRSAHWRRSTSCRRRPKRRTAAGCCPDDGRTRHGGAGAQASHRERHGRSVSGAPRLNPVDRPTYSAEPVDVGAAVHSRPQHPHRPRAIAPSTAGPTTCRCEACPTSSFRRSTSRPRTARRGLAGPQFIRSGLGGDDHRDDSKRIRRRVADSWESGARRTGTSTCASAIPIGASPAEANVARARLQQRQTIAQSRQLELQIATEVTNAALQVECEPRAAAGAPAAQDLAEQRLAGGAEPVRGWSLHELLRGPGAARSARRAERAAAGAARLPPGAGRVRAGPGDSRWWWRRHHGDSTRGRISAEGNNWRRKFRKLGDS